MIGNFILQARCAFSFQQSAVLSSQLQRFSFSFSFSVRDRSGAVPFVRLPFTLEL